MTCTFPSCGHPAYGHNRLGQPMCAGHERVVIGTTDDLGDGGKGSEGADE